MSKSRSPLALIAGPTASGKSALAVELARRSGGVIVNADSAQVYRDLPILSAAPSLEDRSLAEHRLFGFLDGADSCSAADWAARARSEIRDIQSSGRLPIVTGGTGMYLRTLLDGIAPIPAIDPAVRTAIRSTAVEANRSELRSLDPEAAERLSPGDTARIARALEVVRSTGRTLSQWQVERTGGIGGEVELRALIVLPPREWLYHRCDTRFAMMIDGGAIAEVELLLARLLPQSLPVMRSIGVREIAAYLRGECSIDETIAAGSQATRNYAKRQYTWFAHQPPREWPRLTEPLDRAGAVERALALLGAAA